MRSWQNRDVIRQIQALLELMDGVRAEAGSRLEDEAGATPRECRLPSTLSEVECGWILAEMDRMRNDLHWSLFEHPEVQDSHETLCRWLTRWLDGFRFAENEAPVARSRMGRVFDEIRTALQASLCT